MEKKVLVINGPNLNMLGDRETEVYGNLNLEQINIQIEEKAKSLKIIPSFFQSNSESEIIDKLHSNYKKTDALIINAGAFTHTSIAIRDAVIILGVPTIEVHISNIYKRENFRQKSYLSDISEGVICGMGYRGYLFALERIAEIIS
ncbi:MAG: type II 3-dehydroquinate dehydratase [Deltaproteobacteria bacterium]|nr:MAG: type II 3-dehydroquinate dehydratase [Deltaproteobacteria bacterium]